jgi:hypothetical protein
MVQYSSDPKSFYFPFVASLQVGFHGVIDRNGYRLRCGSSIPRTKKRVFARCQWLYCIGALVGVVDTLRPKSESRYRCGEDLETGSCQMDCQIACISECVIQVKAGST